MRNLALLRQRDFALVWTGGLISLIGDWVFLIGLPITVYTLTGSALATTAMFAAGTVPSIVFGTVAGVYVDRWDRKRTLVLGNILLAISLLPLLAVRDASQIWIVYIVEFVSSTLVQFVAPATSAILPLVVRNDELVAANSLRALNQNLTRLIGPSLGGVIAVTLGLGGIAVIDAATFVVAAVLLALLRDVRAPIRAAQQAGGAVRRVVNEWWEGLHVVKERRAVATLFLLIALSAIGEGAFRLLYVLYVSDVLHGGATELGLLMSLQAVGGLAGSLLLVAVGGRVGQAALIGWTAMLFGLIDLVIFNAPAFGADLLVIGALFVLVGVPGAFTFPLAIAVIQAAVPEDALGRVFALIGFVYAALGLVGLFVVGALVGSLGAITTLNIQGGAYVLGGIAMLVLLPSALRVSASPASPPTLIEPLPGP